MALHYENEKQQWLLEKQSKRIQQSGKDQKNVNGRNDLIQSNMKKLNDPTDDGVVLKPPSLV